MEHNEQVSMKRPACSLCLFLFDYVERVGYGKNIILYLRNNFYLLVDFSEVFIYNEKRDRKNDNHFQLVWLRVLKLSCSIDRE